MAKCGHEMHKCLLKLGSMGVFDHIMYENSESKIELDRQLLKLQIWVPQNLP